MDRADEMVVESARALIESSRASALAEEERLRVGRRAILGLSIYNTLSLGRRDLTVFEVVNRLRATWQPAWDTVESVVTVDSVRETADWLASAGLVALGVADDAPELLRIPLRDPRGLGRHVEMNYQDLELVPR